MASVRQLIEDVRIVLDENKVAPSLSGSGDIDTLSIDDIIKRNVESAVRVVFLEADPEMFDGAVNANDVDMTSNVYYSRVTVPDDVVRVLGVKLSSWHYALSDIYQRGDNMYKIQHGSVSCLRGTVDRPVAVYTPDGNSIQMFPYSKDDILEEFWCIYLPDMSKDDISLPNKLYDSVVYTCASLVALTLGDIDKSNAFGSVAKRYYTINPDVVS